MSRGEPARASDAGGPEAGGRGTRDLATALLGGALAGAAAGLIDGLWSWGPMAQFAAGAGGRLRALLFLAASYGLLGALVGLAAGAAAIALWRGTRLGAVAAALAAAHRQARARDPREALIGLSLAIAGVPALAGSLAIGFALAWTALGTRKHLGLVIASAMAIALGALLAAALVALVLGRLVELLLARLARRPAWGRALSSLRAPPIAAGVLLALCAAAGAAITWDTLSLLRLRPLWIGLVGLALAMPALGSARRLVAALDRLRPAARRALLVLVPPALAAVTLLAGAAEGPRGAAVAHSGLADPITRTLRRLGDLDRDGASRLLGGGDCDDGDAAVHPGAREIPDDGIDNNCIGGDATARAAEPAPVWPVPPAVPSDFNVLLVTLDTVRADHLGAYGYRRDTSPRLDELAADGALFENAWAHAPSTRYSIPAILTGRYPLEVRYFDIPGQWPGLAEQNTTIAELLTGRGLQSAAVLNYWYFDRKRKMDQGFAEYDNRNARLHKGIPGEGPARTKGSSSREQTDAAIALLDKLAGDRFFLWVHYYDPHFDYERHPDVPGFGSRRVDLYDHEIRHTDGHIGRLLDDLRRRGLYDRTVVVVTGDHGEGFGEHGIDLHGYHLYAAQTRVPLIIRVPGLPPRRVPMAAGHVDILPTLANLAGAGPQPDAMGRSLLDVMAGEPGEPDRVVFQQLSYEGNHELRGAASRRCHVIYNVSPHTSWEVYRIDRDPAEGRDLSADPRACDDERRALEAWYDHTEIPAGAAEALLPERPAIARPLDIDLGAEARLLAVEMPDRVAPGESLPVTFTFAARGRLTGGWKVFAHFEGPGGRRFQGDHEPPRPLDWWQDGQTIRYTRRVAVPASARPGSYELWVGLFRGEERRPARSAVVRVVDDRAHAGRVEVRR